MLTNPEVSIPVAIFGGLFAADKLSTGFSELSTLEPQQTLFESSLTPVIGEDYAGYASLGVEFAIPGITSLSKTAGHGISVAPAKVVDKSYKLKIQGTAQKTGTPGHQFRTYREAILEAKKPNVQSVHLDHGYNRGLSLDPKTISPNRRPDVLSVYDNGVVRRVEVQSRTDVPAVLRSRNAALDAQIRAQGYTPTAPVVVRPTTTP